MRAIMLCLLVAACTPEIASGSYLCGPDASCPEGQRCNGTTDDNAGLMAETCVLESLAREFACEPKIQSEPDNTMADAYQLPLQTCVAAQYNHDSCMAADDTVDWMRFVAPTCTTGISVQARLLYPIAFAELALELWDVDANVKLADDKECVTGVDTGGVRRCLDFELTAGTAYAFKVLPTGEGNCDGECAHNRYTLTVQLVPPG